MTTLLSSLTTQQLEEELLKMGFTGNHMLELPCNGGMSIIYSPYHAENKRFILFNGQLSASGNPTTLEDISTLIRLFSKPQ